MPTAMFVHDGIFSNASLTAQLALVVGILLLLLCAPPSQGGMMLVPIGAASGAQMLPLAVAQGARLVERGPLPGSFIVQGDRAALLPTMLRHGILTLNAPAAGCGAQIRI